MGKRIGSLLLAVWLLLALLPGGAAAQTAEDTAGRRVLHLCKTGTAQYFELRTPVAVTPGGQYGFSFALTDTIPETELEVVFRVVSERWGERVGVPATAERTAVTAVGTANEYTYTVTMPTADNNGGSLAGKDVYFILRLKKAATGEGYFFDARVWDAGDAEKTNRLRNGDFSRGLTGWLANNQSFAAGAVEGTDSDSATALRVEEYRPERWRTMLRIRNENADMVGESLLLPVGALESGRVYTAAFSYYFVSGALNGSVDFVLLDTPDSNTDRVRLFQSSVATNPVTAAVKDDGLRVEYTFTLTAAQAAAYTHLYAGFFFRQEAKYITELYVAELTLYAADDPARRSRLQKTTIWDMGGWRSNWSTAAVGSDSFGTAQAAALDYTAGYVPYDETLFAAERDVVHYGDGNLDGELDVRDLLALRERQAQGRYLSAADCDADGALTPADSIRLRQHLLGLAPLVWETAASRLQPAAALTGGADAAAAALGAAIAARPDTVTAAAGGTTYYVAADGDDQNDGRSPDRPISAAKLNRLTYAAGDAVRFRRGDTFPLTDYLVPQTGVRYGAYGSGAKPVITGSRREYADPALWDTADGYVWTAAVEGSGVGGVVLDDGAYIGQRCADRTQVDDDGDYYFDRTTGTLYFYWRQINPGWRFRSIQISSTRRFMNGFHAADITLENLVIEHFAEHAVNLGSCSGITVTGCAFRWIGGENMVDSSTGQYTAGRYGNAIQFWGAAADCTVQYTRFWQIYDAAMTFQGYSGGVYRGLTYTHNLVEYSGMNFEFWDGDNDHVTMESIRFTENILRFAGYGLCSQRQNKDNQAFILAWNNAYTNGTIADFHITANVFDVVNGYFFYAPRAADRFGIEGNTYYQDRHSCYSVSKGSLLYPADGIGFREALQAVDAAATADWLEA